MAQSILIPECVSDKVLKRLGKLAKGAGVQLHVTPGKSTVYRKAAVRKRDRDGHSWLVHQLDMSQALECIRVTIEDMPCCNGYEFIGKLVHTEAGNLIAMASSAQGEATPEEWRTAKPTCDHCNTKRSRKDTFIIRCPDGSIKRIGRNCLADFLIGDPSQLINIAVFEDALHMLETADEEEWSSWGGGFAWSISTYHYLACAIASIDARGFFKSGSEEQTTRAHAAFLANPRLRPTGLTHGEILARKDWDDNQPKPEHHQRAMDLSLWLESNEDKGDYIYNLKLALTLPVVRRETEGLIASAPQAYARHLGQIAERKAREQEVDAGYWGEVGKRAEFEATVVSVRNIEVEGGYGPTISRLTKLRTPAGHDITTWTDAFSEHDIGKVVVVKATVKRHEMYRGRHQTTVNRAVLVKEVSEAAQS
jgi:hypothetical protein